MIAWDLWRAYQAWQVEPGTPAQPGVNPLAGWYPNGECGTPVMGPWGSNGCGSNEYLHYSQDYRGKALYQPYVTIPEISYSGPVWMIAFGNNEHNYFGFRRAQPRKRYVRPVQSGEPTSGYSDLAGSSAPVPPYSATSMPTTSPEIPATPPVWSPLPADAFAPRPIPAIDPFSIPIGAPEFTPAPLPWPLIPARRTNPWRAPSEQSQSGYARPQPAPEWWPFPEGMPMPLPQPGVPSPPQPPGEPPRPPVPPVVPRLPDERVPNIVITPRGVELTEPRHDLRRPDKKREREAKVRTGVVASSPLGRALSIVTEADELFDALFDCLPRTRRYAAHAAHRAAKGIKPLKNPHAGKQRPGETDAAYKKRRADWEAWQIDHLRNPFRPYTKEWREYKVEARRIRKQRRDARKGYTKNNLPDWMKGAESRDQVRIDSRLPGQGTGLPVDHKLKAVWDFFGESSPRNSLSESRDMGRALAVGDPSTDDLANYLTCVGKKLGENWFEDMALGQVGRKAAEANAKRGGTGIQTGPVF